LSASCSWRLRLKGRQADRNDSLLSNTTAVRGILKKSLWGEEVSRRLWNRAKPLADLDQTRYLGRTPAKRFNHVRGGHTSSSGGGEGLGVVVYKDVQVVL